MKKYIILGLLALVIGTMVIVPMLKGTAAEEETVAAQFSFTNNLETTLNAVVPIEINLQSDEIQQLELIYNDSIFKIWKNPKGKISFLLNASVFGLGVCSISLNSTMKNGEIVTDNRLITVLSDSKPEMWTAEIVTSFPHSALSYTQGLEFNDGVLYEGTGQYGQSIIGKSTLSTGTIDPANSVKLTENYFGEGITVVGNELFQLTWKEQKCFVYEKSSMKLLKEIPYTGEGWGLCNDGTSIIMSDGSERITFRNPTTFSIERVIQVYTNEGPISQLNELEYIDGKIYANIYTTNRIVVIEPSNGKVIALIDGTKIENEGRGLGEVMNGIAHTNGKTYLTGKHWAKMFEVTFKK